jgi:hypothetical protein
MTTFSHRASRFPGGPVQLTILWRARIVQPSMSIELTRNFCIIARTASKR